jgi:hypothetical protein
MTTEYTGYWRIIYDWQTLIAGALAVFVAVVAAFVAAWPVWRQLSSLRLQSAIAVRDSLTSRVASAEARRASMLQPMMSITEVLSETSVCTNLSGTPMFIPNGRIRPSRPLTEWSIF